MSTDSERTLRKISSRAPVRVDLAGGTLDIWPIYLLIHRPVTVNAGIDLFARADLVESEPEADPKVHLESEDLGMSLDLTWDEIASIKPPKQLVLHTYLLRHFLKRASDDARNRSLSISTKALSPAGAGLGGSSALNIAMTGALHAWASRASTVAPEQEGTALIEVSKDIETRVLHGPAGLQDYYGAMYGGLQKIEWDVGGHHRTAYPAETLKELDDRLLVFYSGQSRNSGINNWALFKDVIDRKGDVHERFQDIAEATRQLARALERRQWGDAARSIAAEWKIRRTLADAISTPEIDGAFERVQRVAPDAAYKICGAGGGGCFLVFLPDADPAMKDRVTEAVVQAAQGPGAIRRLGTSCTPGGLEVTVS